MSPTDCDDPEFAARMANLHGLLQMAMRVELTTIPLYLQAYFSLLDIGDGTVNQPAREAIRSVLVEEMLHLTLAANILSAVGGRPMLDHHAFVPRYPGMLFPDKALDYTVTGHRLLRDHRIPVRLRRFDRDQVALFEDIEAQHSAKKIVEGAIQIDSIGRFYAGLELELQDVVATYGRKRVFRGDPAHQVGGEYYYAAGGQLTTIGAGVGEPLAEALDAIRLITEEGEGLEEGHDIFDGEAIPGHPGADIAHVFKFREILAGRRYRPGDAWDGPPTGEEMAVDWDAAWPSIDDPDPDDPKLPHDIAEAMRAFDRRYSDLLRQINRAFMGAPHLLREAVHGMFELENMGLALMRTPLGNGRTAAPAWRFVPEGCGA